MRRFFFLLVALSVLSTSVVRAEAEKKKGKRKHKAAAHEDHKAAEAGAAGGPFSDVPKGHWAYEAVQKAAEAGILQGWNGRFHGNKVVNRYQMAVVVARMLDRVGVLKANGKVITGQDIANLESLVIEFADELALLNVKVSTLEDTVAGLKRDVDLIKSDMRGVGARAGITGVAEIRYVHTDNNSPGYFFGSSTGLGAATVAPAVLGGVVQAAGVLPAPAAPFLATTNFPASAATSGLDRYRGVQTFPAGAGTLGNGGTQSDRRDFITASNLSLNIDREFDPHTHFHSQIEFNAEGSSDVNGTAGGGVVTPATIAGGTAFAPPAGRGAAFAPGGAAVGNVMVNEAYVTWSDWFTDGVTGRLGIFALPMNTEVNGPSRTYQWTITPSVINSKWESIRPIGLDIFQHNEKDSLMFYVGFFTPGDTQAGEFRSGALLSQATGFGAGAQNDAFQVAPTGGLVGLPGGVAGITAAAGGGVAGATAASAFNVGRFPTPFAGAAMTDQPRGVDGQTLSSNDIGYYAMIGSHPTNRGHRGLSWHVAYYDRNGNLNPGANQVASLTDWYAWQLGASYQWAHVALAAQYYDGTSRNYSTAALGVSAAIPATGIARTNTTPFANAAGFDTDSRGFFTLANWQFNRRGSATVRYEHDSDTTGLADITAETWTFAFNWRTSDHGWLQLEYIDPTTRSRSENGIRNLNDINDDLWQVNYKINW